MASIESIAIRRDVAMAQLAELQAALQAGGGVPLPAPLEPQMQGVRDPEEQYVVMLENVKNWVGELVGWLNQHNAAVTAREEELTTMLDHPDLVTLSFAELLEAAKERDVKHPYPIKKVELLALLIAAEGKG